jgi:hypothetical protein
MPRLKRTVTPVRLAANRRAALGSTGPRTFLGKQRSSLNALRMGRHSNTINLLWDILANAPPFGVLRVARELMTPVQLAHPDVAYLLNLCLAEGDEPIEPDPDPGLGGFLYDQDARRKNRGGGKNKSKPKTPLESTRLKNEPTISLMAQYLANLSEYISEKQRLRTIFRAQNAPRWRDLPA